MFNLALVMLTAFSVTGFAQVRVDVIEPNVLQLLDKPGQYSLATVLGAGGAEADYLQANQGSPALKRLQRLRLNGFFAKNPTHYQEVAKLIQADIRDIVKTTGEPMSFSSEHAETMAKDGKVPRFFDPYWLNSRDAAFALIAVVNRIDKKDFYTETCGEVRLIYRLAYYRNENVQGQMVESRSTLPLFLNVVFDYAKDASGRCQSVAQRWSAMPAATEADGQSLANHLSQNALNKNQMRFKQVELNMQAVRYPSELKFDFGGQAVYLMRIFREIDGRLQTVPLENTINVGEISKSSTLKQALLTQLRDPRNLEKIDNGTFVLENSEGKLLSTRALSFTTIGRARVGNRPFTTLFGAEAKELSELNLSGLKFVKSTRGLVERLNNTTCMGCHQAGSTAGFHMLGRSEPFNQGFNQVVLPYSSHFSAERLRRQVYTDNVLSGKPVSTFRPLSFFTPANGIDRDGLPTFVEGKIRDLCMPTKQTDFSRNVMCAKGFACKATAQNSGTSVTIGECVETPNTLPGNVCRVGVMSSQAAKPELGDIYNLFAIRDTMNIDTVFSESEGRRCTKPDQGVPLGRIPLRCMDQTADGKLEFVDKLATSASKPRVMCVIQGGVAFDDCAKSANPPLCLEQATIARAMLDTCSDTHFCREDYICQKLPDISRQFSGRDAEQVKARVAKLANLGVGFCVPNYFLFNMRADGHIIPEGRSESKRVAP